MSIRTRALPEGTAIGDYRLLEVIGTGSMGEVYEAKHSATQRKVAIKVLRVDAEEAHNAAQRLVEEARAAIAIKHPGIVRVTDLGIYKDRPYMVMERLEGTPLGAALKQKLATVPEAVHILDGILDALSAAHRAGVIHRDLKPSNVFLVGGGKAQGPLVKLLDFGVARRAARQDQLTSPSVAIGSAGFMAPEQLLGQAVASSDLYAVGCIAFLALTGKPVFPLKNIPDNARAHYQEPPPKLRPLRAEISPQLEAWVLRLLAKKPSERHASALIALNDLRAITGATQPGLHDGDDDSSSSRTEVVKAFVPSARPAPVTSDEEDETTALGRPGDSETTGVVKTPEGPGSTIVEDS